MDQNKHPLVSVVVPAYNRAHLIGRAIKSILAQTYQNFEIIVVDDCSKEDIGAALAGFQDSRIRYIRHEVNKGGGGARNTGIEASQADYVAFLDDDDEWLPTKLEKQMEIFQNGNDRLGVVTCSRSKYQGDKKILENWPECKGDVYNYLVNTWRSFGTSTAVIKRVYLDQASFFDANLRSCQELDLFIRLARFCEFDFVNEILIYNHIYPDRIGGNIQNVTQGKRSVLAKIEGDMNKEALSKHRLELGLYYSYAREIGSARKEFIKAIQACPYLWKSYAHLLLSFLGVHLYLKITLSRNEICSELISSQ